MTNPYEVPQAELEGEILSVRKKTGWKVFFWFYLFFEMLGMIGVFFVENDGIFDIVAEFVVYTFVLVGLFAFAYSKKVATPVLWRVVMLILFIWDCYIFGGAFMEGAYTGLNIYITMVILISVAIVAFFQYFALYLYAFQSKEIWNKP